MDKHISVSIRLFAPGLGDLAISLPPMFNLKERGIVTEIHLFVFNKGQQELAHSFPFIDSATIVGFDDDCRKQAFPGFYVDMAEHPLEKIWWGSPEYIENHGMTPVRDIVEQILGGQGHPESNPKPIHLPSYSFFDKSSNKVLLAPGGRRKTKLIPDKLWLTLAERITLLGYDVYLIGDKHHKGSEQLSTLEAKGLKYLNTSGVGEIIQHIRMAKAVVSIDNGLYHIASLLEKPTLGIFGPMPSWLWGGVGSKTVNIDTGCGVNCTSIPLDWECLGHKCMTESFNPHRAAVKFEKEVVPWIVQET